MKYLKLQGGEFMKPGFTIEVKDIPQKPGVKLLEFKGEVDLSTSHKIIEVVFPLINQGHTHLIGDFSQLEYINSSGIFNFLRCYAKIKETNGYLKFINVKPPLYEVLDSLGITKIFPVYNSLEEAIKD